MPASNPRRAGLLSRDLLDRVGDRWSALVLYALHEQPSRFSELKERIDEVGPRQLRRTEISHKMLAETLRWLRRDGLVARSEQAGSPSRAEYRLTALGRSFWEPMMAVHNWTIDHLEELENARRAFDSGGQEKAAIQ